MNQAGSDITGTVERQIATTRLLVVALMLGVGAFAAVVVFVPGISAARSGAPTQILLAGLGVLGASAVGAFVLFGQMASGQARKKWEERTDEEQGRIAIAHVLTVTTLIRAAMVEGAALFGVVVMMVTANRLALIAPAVALVLLATLVPAAGRFRSLVAEATGRTPDL